MHIILCYEWFVFVEEFLSDIYISTK